jgi:hypothetical protein
VNQASIGDMSKACGLLLNRAAAGTLTHGGQEAVDDALAIAPRRTLRTAGGWAWDLEDETVNIAPIVGLTFALLAATVTKKVASGRNTTNRGRTTSRGREAVIL